MFHPAQNTLPTNPSRIAPVARGNKEAVPDQLLHVKNALMPDQVQPEVTDGVALRPDLTSEASASRSEDICDPDLTDDLLRFCEEMLSDDVLDARIPCPQNDTQCTHAQTSAKRPDADETLPKNEPAGTLTLELSARHIPLEQYKNLPDLKRPSKRSHLGSLGYQQHVVKLFILDRFANIPINERPFKYFQRYGINTDKAAKQIRHYFDSKSKRLLKPAIGFLLNPDVGTCLLNKRSHFIHGLTEERSRAETSYARSRKGRWNIAAIDSRYRLLNKHGNNIGLITIPKHDPSAAMQPAHSSTDARTIAIASPPISKKEFHRHYRKLPDLKHPSEQQHLDSVSYRQHVAKIFILDRAAGLPLDTTIASFLENHRIHTKKAHRYIGDIFKNKKLTHLSKILILKADLGSRLVHGLPTADARKKDYNRSSEQEYVTSGNGKWNIAAIDSRYKFLNKHKKQILGEIVPARDPSAKIFAMGLDSQAATVAKSNSPPAAPVIVPAETFFEQYKQLPELARPSDQNHLNSVSYRHHIAKLFILDRAAGLPEERRGGSFIGHYGIDAKKHFNYIRHYFRMKDQKLSRVGKSLLARIDVGVCVEHRIKTTLSLVHDRAVEESYVKSSAGRFNIAALDERYKLLHRHAKKIDDTAIPRRDPSAELLDKVAMHKA